MRLPAAFKNFEKIKKIGIKTPRGLPDPPFLAKRLSYAKAHVPAKFQDYSSKNVASSGGQNFRRFACDKKKLENWRGAVAHRFTI